LPPQGFPPVFFAPTVVSPWECEMFFFFLCFLAFVSFRMSVPPGAFHFGSPIFPFPSILLDWPDRQPPFPPTRSKTFFLNPFLGEIVAQSFPYRGVTLVSEDPDKFLDLAPAPPPPPPQLAHSFELCCFPFAFRFPCPFFPPNLFLNHSGFC